MESAVNSLWPRDLAGELSSEQFVDDDGNDDACGYSSGDDMDHAIRVIRDTSDVAQIAACDQQSEARKGYRINAYCADLATIYGSGLFVQTGGSQVLVEMRDDDKGAPRERMVVAADALFGGVTAKPSGSGSRTTTTAKSVNGGSPSKLSAWIGKCFRGDPSLESMLEAGPESCDIYDSVQLYALVAPPSDVSVASSEDGDLDESDQKKVSANALRRCTEEYKRITGDTPSLEDEHISVHEATSGKVWRLTSGYSACVTRLQIESLKTGE